MPQQVFIKSRNETLEFPDEATQDQINDSVTAMFPPTGKDMADYVEGIKNVTIEGGDLVNPFIPNAPKSLSRDNYILFNQHLADKKTSPGEFFGIAKDTFNQVRDELATGIGTAAYKTYQGEGVEVAKSIGEGMQAGMVGTYDILNKIFDPAQRIPRKEDFVGKVANPNYASNAFMGMGGMSPNVASQDRVNTEEDYNNLIDSQMQRDADIFNRLYAMETTMRSASIPEVARGAQFVDPFLAAGLGGALVKVALKGGKTLITKAAANAAAKAAAMTAGTEGVESAAEAAARTAAQGVDNIPPTVPDAINTIESGGTVPFTPDTNAPMAAFGSTAPSPMAQAGLRAAEGAAGAVQFTAGLPSQALKKIGELAESVAPGTGVGAQATALTGSLMVGGGTPAAMLAGAKTTEKIAELLRSFARVSKEEASRAGRFERIALDPLTSGPTRKAAATLAQFQPAARTIINLSKGAIKGGVAGSVVGGVLGGLAERNLEGFAAGMGAGTALGGFTGTLHAGFDIGKEAFGGSTLRTRTNASGDINRFIASRPELEQAGWIDAMRTLVEKIGPERAASQMDALRVAEASGVKLRIATPDENKLWKAPGWLNTDKGELVLNPPKLRANTPAHEATHAIIASNVKRQYRAQIEEAIYGIPDPVTGEIVKAGFLDDAALAKIAEQIRDQYKKGNQTTAADRFQGLANNLKNSTDKESLMKARSDIADEMAANYGEHFFDRIRPGRFNPDRLPLVYRNALNAIDDGIFNTFKSVVYERGMDLGFDNTTKTFRDANGRPIRVPQLDEIFKRAYSQKSSAETVVSKKPDLIPVKPADRAIWAKTHGGARGILNEDNTPKSIAQINAEAAARWQNMTNKMAPLPESERGGIEFSRDKSGKTTMTAKGQLSPAALTAILESDMLDASANAVLRDVIISMQNPDKSTFDTRYYKVYERGQKSGKMAAGVYPPSQNEILPYKVTMNSKEGVNIHAVDMTQVRQRLATAMNKPQFKELYSNPTDALKDFKKYLDNMTQVGKPALASAELLGENGAAKRNLFHNALGFALRKGEDFSNIPDSVIKNANTVKTYRVERFTKLVDTGFKFPFEEGTTYYRGMKNFQPSAFTPESLPNGESFTNPDGYRILNKTGSKLFRTYDDTGKLIGIAESKEKAMRKAQDEFAKKAMKEEPANIRFQFAGEAAEMPKFMRDSLESAKAMAKEGKDNETIRAITGWFPGKYDDKMRWEVPDNEARYLPATKQWEKGKDQWAANLDEIIDHPALFEAYPEARQIRVSRLATSDTASGSFSSASNRISLNALRDNMENFSTLLHEVQHWIQDKEGFAKGGSPAGVSKYDFEALQAENAKYAKAMRDLIADHKSKGGTAQTARQTEYGKVLSDSLIKIQDAIKQAEKDYRRIAGEIESRDIEARQSFTPEQRKAIAPYSSENIAKDEAIVLKSASKSPTEMRFQPDENLVTVHNLTEPNLKHALKVGGLAVPSLAVVRTDLSNFDSFGDITLLAKPNLIDPQLNKASKVFNADVYSPRYPTVKTVFKRNELDKVSPIFKGYSDELANVTKKGWSWSTGNLVQMLEDEGFNRLQSNHLAQYAYLRDAGLIEPPKGAIDSYEFGDLLRKQTNELRDEVVNFVQSKVDDAGVKYEEKIPDGYTNSGTRRFLPHDLDTVVKIMTRKLKDGEGFNYGVPSIRAANAKPFKTLKAIKNDRDKIITSEKMEALKKEVDQEFITLAESALEARKSKPSFGGLDAVSDDMKALVQGDNSWIREMYGDSPVVQDMKTFVAKLRDMPTEYFEAKVKRAVQLQEFEAAVVPMNTPEDVKAALRKKGLAVREYDPNNKDSRKAVIQSVSSEFNIRFQPDPTSPNILNGSNGSRIIKSTSGKYQVYLATGALAGVKETLESAQKLIERKSNK